MEKLSQYKIEKQVWEAKWKLFETKRRWPSLGMSKEEEEIITGRSGLGVGAAPGLYQRDSMGGRRKERDVEKDRIGERDRDKDRERDKRERLAEIGRNGIGRDVGSSNVVVKSMAPESIKERLALLRQKLEEELAKKKEADAGWDDATDVSPCYPN